MVRRSGQYFDLAPTLLNPDGTFVPGVMLPGNLHPDIAGYQRWAAMIEPSVKATIG